MKFSDKLGLRQQWKKELYESEVRYAPDCVNLACVFHPASIDCLLILKPALAWDCAYVLSCAGLLASWRKGPFTGAPEIVCGVGAIVVR